MPLLNTFDGLTQGVNCIITQIILGISILSLSDCLSIWDMGSNGTKKYPPLETLVQCVASCSYMLNYQFYLAFLKWGDLKLAGWFIMGKCIKMDDERYPMTLHDLGNLHLCRSPGPGVNHGEPNA